MPTPDRPQFIRGRAPGELGSIVVRSVSTEKAYVDPQPHRQRVIFATQDEELLTIRVDFSSGGKTPKTADLRNLFSIRDGVDIGKVTSLLRKRGIEPILPDEFKLPAENEAEALQHEPASVGKLDTDTGVVNHHRRLLRGNFKPQPRRPAAKPGANNDR
jgi:hypothetical protein